MYNVFLKMILVDRKILVGGIAMLVVGIALSTYLASVVPVGHEGMSEEEALELIVAERENQDYSTLAGILIGVGFLLVLISFGARRRRRGGIKKEEKKPAE